MVFISRQEPFDCEQCEAHVLPLEHGSCRNHCPVCLWSKHVDLEGPGDRASECQGLMQPVLLDQDGKKGWMILHRCTLCHAEKRNKAAPDDDLTACRLN
ncbi:MAG TPA: RNHCP domain-containing protein [Candidatus Peribacteraceae bacterium]|nr:RNHCP domain-containing protein [Candidatus Peribacteraceae bacterium]